MALHKRNFNTGILPLLAFSIGVACAFFLFFHLTFAASNYQINYQGKLTSSTSAAVSDGAYNMVFKLYTAPTGGSPIWTENDTSTHHVQVTNGLFSVMLGSTTALSGVNFNQTLYLGVTVGSDSEMTPRKVLGAVPAAFESKNAQTLGGVASTSFLRSDQADTASGLLSFTGGLISNAASSTITNLTMLTATTTYLSINGERFSDLTGTGLQNTGGALGLNTTYLDTRYASTSEFDTCSELSAILAGDTTGSCGSFVLSASPTFTGTVGASALTVSSTLTLSGTAANIALGSNYLSGDGGDEGVFVGSNGNVGIGTNTPTDKFEVAGDIVSKGTTWTAHSAAGDDDGFRKVVFGNGRFVAVGSGSDDHVMYSDDGINWATSSAAGDDDGWNDITYGNGLFVAVAGLGDDLLMTSSDGVNWTPHSVLGDDDGWLGITYGNGLFVAVGSGTGGDYIMTSPDGITWTSQGAPEDLSAVTFGNGLFVAVSYNNGAVAVDTRVLTSPDGVTWTPQTAVGDNDGWTNVTYANGLFVAVGYYGDRVMTSPDGINWTVRSAAGNNDSWFDVGYGDGLYVAVGYSGDRLMTSPDGITWTVRSVAGNNDSWGGVAYGNGRFVAVGYSGDNRVITSGRPDHSTYVADNVLQGGWRINGGLGIGTTSSASTLDVWGNLYVGTSSTPTLFANTGNGRVGIGSSSPSAKLTVEGDTYLGGTIVTTGFYGNDISIHTPDGASAVDIEKDGNISIGFDNVVGPWDNAGPIIIGYGNDTSAATDGVTYGLGNTISGDSGMAFGWGNTVSGLNASAFGNSITNDVDYSLAIGYTDSAKLTILSTGQFGIGTTTPAKTLSVAGDVRITGTLYGSNNSAGSNGYVLKSTGTGFQWVATSSLGIGGGASTFLALSDTPSSYNTGRVLYESGSAVTDSPALTFNGSTFAIPGFTFATGTVNFLAATKNIIPNNTANAWTIATSATANPIISVNTTSGAQSVTFGTASSSTVIAFGDTGMPLTIAYNAAAISTLVANTDNAFSFATSSTARSIFDVSTNGGGRIGIGTTTPFSKLTVAGGSDTVNVDVGSGPRVKFGSNTSANGYLEIGSYNSINDIDTKNRDLRIFSNSDSTGITYTNATGRLGIGTSTPSSALQVASGNFELGYANTARNLILNLGNGNDHWQFTPATTTGSNLSLQLQGTNAAGYLNLKGGTGGVGLTTTGNIGVGTSTPASKLDVWGNLRVSTSSTPLLLANTAGGKVLIGTSSLSSVHAKLVVDGGVHVTGGLCLGSYKEGCVTPPAGNRYLGFGDGGNSYIYDDGSLNLNGVGIIQSGAGSINMGDPMIFSAQQMEFQISGVTKMELGNNGNIAIGTTSATFPWTPPKLNVWGNFRVGTSSIPTLYANTGNRRVGIGTSSPTQALTVAGSIRATGALYGSNNSAGSNGYVLKSTGTGFQWVATSSLGLGGGSSQWTSSGSNIYFNTGKVSIGTTTPHAVLTVATTSPGVTGININQAFNVNGSATSSALSSNITAGFGVPGAAIIAGRFNASQYDNGEGNIGVDTTAVGGSTHPNYSIGMKSTVSGSIANGYGVKVDLHGVASLSSGSLYGYYVDYSGAGSGLGIASNVYGVYVKGSGATINAGTNYGVYIDTLSGTSRYGLYQSDTSAPNYFAGKVGIGTTTPSAKLQITGTAGSGDIFAIASSTNARLLTFTAGGRLGIGTSTPTQALTVAGSIRATGALYGSNNSAGSNGYVLKSTGTGFQWVATSSLGLGGASTFLALSDTPSSYNTGRVLYESGSAVTDSSTFTFANSKLTAPVFNASGASTTIVSINGKPILQATTTTGFTDSLSIGYKTGSINTLLNTAVGNYALTINSGSYNSALGSYALESNTSGSQNTAFGAKAALYTTGNNNIAIGFGALERNTSGNENTVVGGKDSLAGSSGSAVYGNTVLGFDAGYNLGNGSGTDYNTLLGYDAAGNLSGGSSNIIIGSYVFAPNSAGSKQLDIGNVLYGTNMYDGSSFGSSDPVLTGRIGIGTTSPASKLDVWGNLRVGTSSKPTLFANTGNGRVGIGTSTPASKLTIVGGNVTQIASGNPTLKGTYDTSGNTWASVIIGKYAYVADDTSGLEIIDVSNPSSPSLVGTYNTAGTAFGVTVSGKYAYVADDTSGLEIIDVSNPSSPSLVGSYNTSGTAWSVTVSGKYAYVADDTSGLEIIDVSNPSSPSLVGNYNSPSLVVSVTVSGKYAYVADYTSGLEIIDVSNPASPSLVGSYNTSGFAVGVTVSGKYAYVADSNTGLQIIGVSNPASPSLVGTYVTNVAENVAVAGKYAYVADYTSGLKVLDISNPASPSLVGAYDTSGTSIGVTVSGKYAYVADSDAGLQIIDINGAEFPSLYAGNIETNVLNATENIIAGNDIYAQGGITAGLNGIFSRGGIFSYVASSTIANPVSAAFMGGNVGIGTTTPAQKLTITGGMRLTGALYDSLNSPGANGYVLQSTATGQKWVATSTLGISSGPALFTDGGATTYLTATGDNFAIGTSTATNKLNIWGSLRTGTSSLATLITTAAGFVGIGVNDPDKKLEVFNTVSDAQFKISYDATRFANFQVDSVGALIMHSYGHNITVSDDNLSVCESGSCPSITASSSAGYVIVENGVYFGNGFRIDQITGTTTQIGVYNASGSVIMIFDQ